MALLQVVLFRGGVDRVRFRDLRMARASSTGQAKL
jgi:hypothetical protein